MKKIIFLGLGLFFIVIFIRTDWLALTERTITFSDPLQKADVLIVPSGSSMEERIRYAAKLYREGYEAPLLLTGYMTLQKETGIDLMKAYAIQLGVPENNIMREPHSDTTWMNAVESWKILRSQGIRSVLIVTSPQHARRAKMLFRKAFPKEVEVRVASEPLPPARKPWYRNEARLRDSIHEYLSFVWFYLSTIGSDARN